MQLGGFDEHLDHDGVLSAEGLGVNHMEGEYGATS
jgi:hypothetical protein